MIETRSEEDMKRDIDKQKQQMEQIEKNLSKDEIKRVGNYFLNKKENKEKKIRDKKNKKLNMSQDRSL